MIKKKKLELRGRIVSRDLLLVLENNNDGLLERVYSVEELNTR